MSEPIFLATGADHRGVAKLTELKSRLVEIFPGLVWEDVSGRRDNNDNFNLPACRVTEKVLAKEVEVGHTARTESVRDGEPIKRNVFGLLICGSGHGMTIQANRFLGIRAINAPDPESAREGRAHSDANVLCLAADRLEIEEMVAITKTFVETNFENLTKYRERIRLLDLPPMMETEVLPELSNFPIFDNSNSKRQNCQKSMKGVN